MNLGQTTLITKEDALKALPDRETIHCFMGMFGADWDSSDVQKEIRNAEVVAWSGNIFEHELAVQNKEGKVMRFDVKAPQPELSEGE